VKYIGLFPVAVSPSNNPTALMYFVGTLDVGNDVLDKVLLQRQDQNLGDLDEVLQQLIEIYSILPNAGESLCIVAAMISKFLVRMVRVVNCLFISPFALFANICSPI
jgi:hypothetical protein